MMCCTGSAGPMQNIGKQDTMPFTYRRGTRRWAAGGVGWQGGVTVMVTVGIAFHELRPDELTCHTFTPYGSSMLHDTSISPEKHIESAFLQGKPHHNHQDQQGEVT